MEKLGLSMQRTTSRIPKEQERQPPPAGYTYFGQFVDHDLTLDETPFLEAIGYGSTPAQTINRASARLNLNHLYGSGPGSVQHGYLYENDGASFRLGKVRTKQKQTFDLPVGPNGPESAEARNTQNLILRQLCVMFLKLHNLAVREFGLSPLEPFERFQRARNRVCWQYQGSSERIIFCEITTPEVYDEVITNRGAKSTGKAKDSPFRGVSQAVFRFGHSMVRTQYDFNSRGQGYSAVDVVWSAQKEKAIDQKHGDRLAPIS
jgi:hypothetical protein